MQKHEAFPSRFFKAEDVKSGPIVVTIDKLYQGPVGPDKEEKHILSFTNTEKELVCNATNWDAIADITGKTDSDDWSGHKIILVHERVSFGGKTVDAVRIRPPAPPQQRVKTAPKPVTPQQPDEVTGHLDDEVPFDDDYRV
jgi:hypothetical protein